MSAAELAAAPAPTIAVTVEPSHMAAKLTVGVPAGATTMTVWRVSTASGNRADVRGWVAHDVTGVATALVFDWEVPIGVELRYYAQAVVAGAPSDVGSSAPLTLTDDRDWLVDLARPTNTMPIVVESLPELGYDGPVGVHRVLDRRDPILTSAPLWTPTGTLTFVTATLVERDRARDIVGSGYAVLLRTPPEHGPGNFYAGVTGLSIRRASRLAQHEDRRFVVEVVQLARPDASVFVPLAPLTYRNRLAQWPTYRAATATGKSYQELAYTFPDDGSGAPSPYPPWLPDDV